MPGTFVVDASVVVDFLAPRGDDPGPDRLMAGLGWEDPLALLAPDLMFIEAANALRKLHARRALSSRGTERAVAALARLPVAAVGCSSLLEAAWTLRGSLATYDAAYLALARDMDLPFVTTDRRLVTTARRAGIRGWHADDPQLTALLDTLAGGAADRP